MFADLTQIDDFNIGKVKTLNQGIFPVSYSPTFYQECMDNDLCQTIIQHGEAVAIVCLKPEIVGCAKVMYVRSLGVSPLLRESGIGSRLLHFVEMKTREYKLDKIMLHVQVSNQIAIDFYQRRGFVLVETVKNYYRRCLPADAHLMIRRLQ
ncbi:unnamed protein product [Caenorhabditis auriculariae]|uniref:N-terminal methionine N(alpha)-acetyltransferase NatE n=1 Tax=Caenorhabditis auriculariae TaxID=2777116 RepID=A0A8S1GQ59_9PELO|nr:unnamed protein product [Caenorhabditis auriculariae]